MNALTAWTQRLAAWEIPAAILDRVPDSPWVLPRQVFVRRADQQIRAPSGASYEATAAALAEPGTVLDIGAAAGAASLPLAGRVPVTGITAVDTDPDLLDDFTIPAAAVGVPVRLVRGWWPDIADETGVADVVVCGHVLYNIPDLGPFVQALTSHARRRVVAEITERHPLAALNPLWQHFHGLDRPDRPTAADCVDALAEVGIHPTVTRWSRPAEPEYASFAELVDVTRRRLCLPVGAAAEVEAALRDLGLDQEAPPDLGSSGRDLVTLVWEGTADRPAR